MARPASSTTVAVASTTDPPKPGYQRSGPSALPQAATDTLRRGLVAVPVVDAEEVTMVLAWPGSIASTDVAEFVAVAREVAGAQSAVEPPSIRRA